MTMRKVAQWVLQVLLCGVLIAPHSLRAASLSDTNELDLPIISIIIDDLGYHHTEDRRAIRLPGPVACAFLPHTPNSRSMARFAHYLGKEVLLHQPMQATRLEQGMDPGALTLDMSEQDLIDTLQGNLAAIPYVSGINNHMGSLLTQHPGHMQWLMNYLAQRDDLFFIDSMTTDTSIAFQLASENWVPNLRRDVFLDHDRSPASIAQQFQRLLQTARRNGSALAIGHPYPETLALLEQQLPKLAQSGYRLVPVSVMLKLRIKRFRTWHAYLSP